MKYIFDVDERNNKFSIRVEIQKGNAFNANASSDKKKIVSCNAVIRAIGTGDSDIPVGATQGSMAALGYSQSWTIGSGGATAELYLSRTDKKILGSGNSIGSHSPIEELV